MIAEEFTIKNKSKAEAAVVPNAIVIEPPKLKLKLKLPPKPVSKEVEQLRAYARAMTHENKHKLTLCPRCDKQGYAKYVVRSNNYKLILKYLHSNEPPVGQQTTKAWNKTATFNTYRECWVGNILSEEQFFEKYVTTKSKSAPALPEPIITKVKVKVEIPKVKKKGGGPKAKTHVGETYIRVWVENALAREIVRHKGKLPITTFVREFLREAVKFKWGYEYKDEKAVENTTQDGDKVSI